MCPPGQRQLRGTGPRRRGCPAGGRPGAAGGGRGRSRRLGPRLPPGSAPTTSGKTFRRDGARRGVDRGACRGAGRAARRPPPSPPPPPRPGSVSYLPGKHGAAAAAVPPRRAAASAARATSAGRPRRGAGGRAGAAAPCWHTRRLGPGNGRRRGGERGSSRHRPRHGTPLAAIAAGSRAPRPARGRAPRAPQPPTCSLPWGGRPTPPLRAGGAAARSPSPRPPPRRLPPPASCPRPLPQALRGALRPPRRAPLAAGRLGLGGQSRAGAGGTCLPGSDGTWRGNRPPPPRGAGWWGPGPAFAAAFGGGRLRDTGHRPRPGFPPRAEGWGNAVVTPSRNPETLPCAAGGARGEAPRWGGPAGGGGGGAAWATGPAGLAEVLLPSETTSGCLRTFTAPSPPAPCRPCPGGWGEGGRRAFCRGSQTRSVAELVENLNFRPVF